MAKLKGDYSSLSIGEGNIINNFNADGSFVIRGNGTFNKVTSNLFKGEEYIITSNIPNITQPYGILSGGIGHLTGLSIDKNNLSEESGKITFTGDYLTQGIKFADGTFLNSAKNIDNIKNGILSVESINLTGNITGINSSAVFNTINCLDSTDFNLIKGNIINCNNITSDNGNFNSLETNNNLQIPNFTSNNATFNSITSNKIITKQITFSNDYIQTSAPGIIINGNISNNIWNGNDLNNASLYLPIGTWIVYFNIVFIRLLANTVLPPIPTTYITVKSTTNIDTSGNNIQIIPTTNNLSQYGSVYLSTDSNKYICNGTYIHKALMYTKLNLICNENCEIDLKLSYHKALKI